MYNLFKTYNHIVKKVRLQCLRKYSEKNKLNNTDVSKIRNIGILAHIDAGKTTTTERMLFYSGTITQMGEVHHGNTVTDYMDQERDRGITIRSAAVTFPWKKHQFNLIDTPGHIDFTMEVEETLNVLDGCVIILDSSAGVEAQTLTVWRQAERYNIPRIIFANKMDRADANLEMCYASIKKKLDCETLAMQLPVIENNKFVGIIDVLSLEKLVWPSNNENEGINKSLLKESDGHLWESALLARHDLIDKVSAYDDQLASVIIESESMDNVTTTDVVRAIKNAVLKNQIVPVFCGSAYKNIGVQPLMDAVILYLPSPEETNEHFKCFGSNLSARSFKILHDKQRGALVFFRIYSGEINKGQRIFNIQTDESEQVGKLLVAYADEYKEIDSLGKGQIAVVSGLKKTVTGELITNSSSAAQKAKRKMEDLKISKDEMQRLFFQGANVPEPVFFCSIEPPSLAYASALEQALLELQREDPSLRVTYNEETGQTVLAGMGELHLEIIKDRILKEYKVDADLGPLQISYKEAPINSVTTEFSKETKIGSSKQLVTLKMSLIKSNKVFNEKEILLLDKTQDAASNLASIFPKHLLAVKNGINVAVSHGPKVAGHVINLQFMLHYFMVGKGTSDSMISATTTNCVQKLLKDSGTTVLEPIMYLEIVVPEEHVSSIMLDLNRRRALIHNVSMRGNNKMVTCETPLAELLGYSKFIRTVTSGTGTYSMEFLEYRIMSSADENQVMEQIRGF